MGSSQQVRNQEKVPEGFECSASESDIYWGGSGSPEPATGAYSGVQVQALLLIPSLTPLPTTQDSFPKNGALMCVCV